MEITTRKVLRSLELVGERTAINVKWEIETLADGEVINKVNFRRAYTQEQKPDFLTDLGDDATTQVVDLVNWTV